MTADELDRMAAELGIDVVGATPAAPYAETERQIVDRKARGLFADMRFTMARPDVSCHPELLFAGARTVVSAARCYYAPAPVPDAGEGRLPRYAWRDNYAILRDQLDELGRRLGGEYRVLVDENQHVDREAARRAGIGFYGKNTLIITREHGSWVVLGTLVTAAAVDAGEPLAQGCGSCTLCIEACPTDALEELGVLDATRCLSYWTQAGAPIPDEFRDPLGDLVYGCDICQEVCPWNRGVEKRRRELAPGQQDTPTVRLRDWLDPDDTGLRARFGRLYVPANDARWLRRNALVAAGNSGSRDLLPLVEQWEEDDDEMLRETARWARERIETGAP